MQKNSRIEDTNNKSGPSQKEKGKAIVRGVSFAYLVEDDNDKTGR
jgi:hypothetical protein